ncbi:MAG: hypothetical protein ACI802_002835 [Candidatus Paceibacteria bacterium]|jgi:hypothetical protein
MSGVCFYWVVGSGQAWRTASQPYDIEQVRAVFRDAEARFSAVR